MEPQTLQMIVVTLHDEMLSQTTGTRPQSPKLQTPSTENVIHVDTGDKPGTRSRVRSHERQASPPLAHIYKNRRSEAARKGSSSADASTLGSDLALHVLSSILLESSLAIEHFRHRPFLASAAFAVLSASAFPLPFPAAFSAFRMSSPSHYDALYFSS